MENQFQSIQETQTRLVEKWKGVIDHEDEAKIEDTVRRRVTAQLLENTQKEAHMNGGLKISLNEVAQTGVANMANYDPILISLVRRMSPKLIAYDVCGVQPMTMPTGLIFCLRARYNSRTGQEALFYETDTDYSGTGVHAGNDPFDIGFTTGTAKLTQDGESDPWNPMTMTIEKTHVEAKTRQLRSDISAEIKQDFKSVLGGDAEAEMINILSSELINEINREVIRKIYSISKVGAQFAGTPGTFDLLADSDGRWSVERFKGLVYAIERDANAISIESRRGKGNIIITSPDVASALVMAGLLVFNNAGLVQQTQLEVDVTGTTFAGTLLGRYKVYVDPYLGTNGYVVGYKGSNPYDAGMFYCPYVPLQLFNARDPVTFQDALGFKTRYGIVSNPFTSLDNASNIYYRKAKIANL